MLDNISLNKYTRQLGRYFWFGLTHERILSPEIMYGKTRKNSLWKAVSHRFSAGKERESTLEVKPEMLLLH